MGYNTDFWGEVRLDPPLTKEQQEYLHKFNATRRMKRDSEKLAKILDADPLVGGVFGVEGEFFVGGEDYKGQGDDDSIIDYNNPPSTQPGLWCGWCPGDDGASIVWDESEKFYDYVEWMLYLMKTFIIPWGITANGTIEWDGEESDDRGRIVVKNNVVTAQLAQITWGNI